MKSYPASPPWLRIFLKHQVELQFFNTRETLKVMLGAWESADILCRQCLHAGTVSPVSRSRELKEGLFFMCDS